MVVARVAILTTPFIPELFLWLNITYTSTSQTLSFLTAEDRDLNKSNTIGCTLISIGYY